MSSVVVIGNGESRKVLNLDFIDLPKIGCNALHRDHKIDYLITCDRRMLQEAIRSPNTLETKIYVRPENYHHFRKMIKDKRIEKLPDLPYQGNLRQDDPIHWGSGCFAVLLASILEFQEIILLGFDLYGINNCVNNVYKNTVNYLKEEKPAVDPSYWIYQIAQVFDSYPDKKFIIYNHPDWELPKKWMKPNVEKKFLSSFEVDNKYVSCILQEEV